ncbi:MAG: Coenzyme F420 hydrogenase/dehydrogenase, beta subunit C-terminal domain [Candidatus Thorarchaeota archaeon]
MVRPILEEKVILAKKCTACGGCSAVCPVNCFDMDELTAIMSRHCIECLRCDLVCPVLEGYDPDVGFYKEYIAAKSKFAGQDGGLTQAIIHKLFEDGLIDAAIGITSDEDWNPYPKIITSFEEFSDMALSRYTYSPLLPAIHQAIKDGHRRIGVIGVGCQVHSAAMARENVRELGGSIAFLLGLVCTKTFQMPKFLEYLNKNGIKDVTDVKKFDITKGKLIIEWGEDQQFTDRIKKLGTIAREGCWACEDVCAMSADISLGAVGANAGYNSVIVRSSYGMELWDRLKPTLEDIQPAKLQPMQRLNELKRGEVQDYLKQLGEEFELRTQV